MIYVLAAVLGYFIAGFNPAILLSRGFYGKDIREQGSGNPGFTNFKRCFGGKLAWAVLVLDMLKAAIAVVPMGFLFKYVMGEFVVGAAFTGMFCVLGHAYPVIYRFKGGKGFLVALSTLWAVDLRVGAISTLVMIALLLITHYMSMSTVVSLLISPIFMALLGAPLPAILFVSAFVCFTAVRHKENFKRLISGTESKFYFKSQKSG